jgi:class 3 adenylate cyclase
MALSRANLGTFHILGRSLGSPRTVYSRYGGYLNKLQEIGRYDVKAVTDRSAVISFAPQAALPCPELDCAYRRGALEGIPTLWDLPLARVTHRSCVARGAAECLYDIEWLPLRQRRAAVAGVAVGAAVGAALWGGLAAAGLVPATVAAAFAVALPWALVGGLAVAVRLGHGQLADASRLVDEQVGVIENELKNVWLKYEEIQQKAEEERRTRRLFQKFVPAAVVDRALRQEGALMTGEAVDVVVLFCDLAGFTPFAETVPPAEVMATINRYLSRFSEVVSAHRGIVDKFIGDAVMALFGAPVPDPDAARHAVECGLELLAATERLNRETGRDFRLRVGIHAGPAVAGNVGSPERIAYTAMGDTVNVAQRLQIQARPGSILVSDAVKERCGGTGTFRPSDPITVRGRSAETRIFEVG